MWGCFLPLFPSTSCLSCFLLPTTTQIGCKSPKACVSICLVPCCIRSTDSYVVFGTHRIQPTVRKDQSIEWMNKDMNKQIIILWILIVFLILNQFWVTLSCLPKLQVLWDGNGMVWHDGHTFWKGMRSVRGMVPTWHKVSAQFVVIYCYGCFSVAMIKCSDQNTTYGFIWQTLWAQSITQVIQDRN